MPQKKNPDACELIRARAARLNAAHNGLASLMSGLPLTYNKDLQEDKIYVFDAADTLLLALPVTAEMTSGLRFMMGRMRQAAEESFALATDVADYLVGKGMAFRDAHRAVGRLVKQCIDEGRGLAELRIEELRQEAPQFDEDYYQIVDLDAALERKSSFGSTAPAQVEAQLADAASRLKEMQDSVRELQRQG